MIPSCRKTNHNPNYFDFNEYTFLFYFLRCQGFRIIKKEIILMSEMAKLFIFVGLVFVMTGIFIVMVGKIPGFGKWPGDILIKKEHFTFYFPITTSIVISLILSLILFLWNRK